MGSNGLVTIPANTVRDACVEMISLAIQRKDRDEHYPVQLADDLMRIAEATSIPAEAVIRWIHQDCATVPVSTRAFNEWANTYALAREVHERKPACCAHCGRELRSRAEAYLHICPEDREV